MRNMIYQEWNNILLLEKSSPYLFRTRLERALNHTIKYATMEKNNELLENCKMVIHKLQYISDQSNQTSDGCLNSFLILEEDMLLIKNKVSMQVA